MKIHLLLECQRLDQAMLEQNPLDVRLLYFLPVTGEDSPNLPWKEMVNIGLDTVFQVPIY